MNITVGGQFHGPVIATLSMPKDKYVAFITQLLNKAQP